MDWRSLFVPQESLPELVLRGTILYLLLLGLLRVIFRRETGNLGLADLLVVVLIADAAANGLAGDYQSITGGVVLVCTIVGWSYLLDLLAYRFPRVGHFIRPGPLLLVRKGRMLHMNMRRELITEEELRSLLREQGVEDIHAVRSAYLEVDGRLSVIKYGSKNQDSTSG